MALSSLTLTTFEARVAALLNDSAHTPFPLAQIDQSTLQALEEYNRASRNPDTQIVPNQANGTLTPTANAREWSLSSLTGFLELDDGDDRGTVWFPYTAAAPENPPNRVNGYVLWSAGVPAFFLTSPALPNGTNVARFFYLKAHTLNGLNSETVTTFQAVDENILVEGACGFACLTRAIDLSETAANMVYSTPNYAILAKRFLAHFREALALRSVAHFKPLLRSASSSSWYDPSKLGFG